ncbi:2-succinyl-5-enolpyruvyl-6-hydroxy-3-cyclohexene-1-carboxylic-acid synthase [Neobacillus terrae]|uniref:2-succinyl-5-enolpyruvyl-6-hydroxy-3- cyclohexene-1-carboxylic-acid synthase n=1 Tax=Neobacillus terrae TaxID=3034837 RepID=UPI00140D4A23|nr:2-succinyl-5-enolpyruvyl-6-hydroxy-3-cyclohexene-1-carboxylic-acid synthase [Neobacillus terrae]NHM33152.1 2-succinyl-5-enolpyruvyl-6-hydroxy-3-cyclohexene-1-carboxylic-acid synthase [Neobacillus terrae]
MNHQESLTAYTAAFVAELVNTGVTDVVISPGSRSTPLALVMAEHTGLNLHIHVDERSAAFFALGIAKATERAVAILCTSGTAAANYFPAVAEANLSRVPLIVITADRPHELRDVGAPQAMDQINLYGKHVKWFAEMSPPEKTSDMLRYVRTTCARAAATAVKSPAGPVHLNFPFREPLIPDLNQETLFRLEERKDRYVNIHRSEWTIDDSQFDEITQVLNMSEKGIIICGQISNKKFAEEVTALSKKLGYPIVADPLSQLRSGTHSLENIIDTYDSFLRNEDAKSALKPEVILRFGALPVSKALSIFIKENHSAVQFVVDGGGGWRDPAALSTDMIYCEESRFCKKVSALVNEKQNHSYLNDWKKVNELTKASISMVKDFSDSSESRLFYQLTDLLPEKASVFVGNSMPIRDLDSYFHNTQRQVKVFANRGANGIDGTISTALGAALYSGPMYLILGDLTFFHDLNGLLAAKLYDIDLNIIIVNNNGGGIFSFLPQASLPRNYELLFGTPIDLDFEHVVRMYNGNFSRSQVWDHFAAAFSELSPRKGLNVFEIVTNRDKSRDEHREMWNSVSREISKWVNGEQK